MEQFGEGPSPPRIINLRVHWHARQALKVIAAERGETMSQCLLALVHAARRAEEKQKETGQ